MDTTKAGGASSGREANAPVVSVIVPAYRARAHIDAALASLRRQDLGEPFETIVVDSGDEGCAEHVAAAFPETRVLRSETRLLPGAARNRGVRAARGHYVAFLPADCTAAPDWLRRRVALHREGYDAVGGAIVNGTPASAVGTAGYLLEYASVAPSAEVLERQAIPHGISYTRSVFARLGEYPEELEAGEDTTFNRSCVDAGIRFAFDPGIRIAHANLTGFASFLRHQYGHGRGLVRTTLEQDAFPALAHRLRMGAVTAAFELLVRYPAGRLVREASTLRLGRPEHPLRIVALSPLLVAGVGATALGAWAEWRARR